MAGKVGRRSQAHKRKLLEGFMEIYRDGGTSIFDAAEKMNTTYETARTNFLKCAEMVAEANHIKNETWLEKRERTVDRAMEAITKRKNETMASRSRIGYLLVGEYAKHKDLTTSGTKLFKKLEKLDKQIAKAENPDTIKELAKARKVLIGLIGDGQQTFTATINQISSLEKQFLETQAFILDLQEKYNALEIRPPANQILQAELELYLGQKAELELSSSA